MIRTVIFALAVALAGPSALAIAHAQAPQAQTSTTRLVRFAGVLTDAAGSPLNGAQTVTFTLFDQAEGGTALWTEALPITADDRGRYAVNLGSTTPLPQDLFTTEQARWIDTAIGGRDLGRTALVAVPYALKAADADTLGGHAAATYVRTRGDGRLETSAGVLGTSAGVLGGAAVDGTGVAGQIAKWTGSTTLSSSVISESPSNRIGFGLTDPTGGGVVDSVFTIKNYDNNTGFGILNETQQRRFAINTLANGGWLLYDGGNSTWNSGLYQRAGTVGIGTTSPLGRLGISSGTTDGIWVQSTTGGSIIGDTYNSNGSGTGVRGQSYSGVGVVGYSFSTYGVSAYSATGTGLNAWSSSGVAAYLNGRVGIATSVPADMLEVWGDIRVGTGTTGCVKDSDGTVIAGTCASDARLKKNITPFTNTLNQLTQLQPVHFEWRTDEFPDRHFGVARSFGLVAQDVEAILPELVVTDADGFKAIRYSELPLYLLQGLKELKAENDAVKTENATLKQQLQAQDARAQQQDERLRRLEGWMPK